MARVYIQSIRLAFALVCLGASLLLACQWLGFFPDVSAIERENRRRFSEAVAIQSASHVRKSQWVDLKAISETLVDRDPTLLSIGVRSGFGQLKAHAGHHQELWTRLQADPVGLDAITVPITLNRRPWGQVELCFLAPEHSLSGAFIEHPLVRPLAFFCIAGMFGYTLFVGKVMRIFNSTQVVPDRVRQALDTLAEGLLVLDEKSKIILANQAFADTVGVSSQSLVEHRAEELDWISGHDEKTPDAFPWQTAIEQSLTVTETILRLSIEGQKTRIFSVNAAPIEGDGSRRGALVTFRDVTMIVEHRQQLEETLTMLSASRDQIEQKNRELEILATQDALTGCLNRRAFFEKFGRLWQFAKQEGRPLSCIMVDNDHFKRVNDTYGHAVGDDVLREVSRVLRTRHKENGVVCRYGGEEFCVLLPNVDFETALTLAEGTRKAIEEVTFAEPSELKLTASLGVSETRFDATEPQELINQADVCLYAAKRRGRNCVVAFEPSLELTEQEDDEKRDDRQDEVEASDSDLPVSRSAVEALLASLAYRDPMTAQHCRRVASLCDLVGDQMMEQQDLDLLRCAALLHDIGKIAVPDHILLKRGRLSPDEIDLIRQHERLGIELIERAFQCSDLTTILKCRRADYNGFGKNRTLPSRKDIPLAARLLAVCDSYDSMTHDHIYRDPRSHDAAVEELRRNAGTQFDPELVEYFANTLSNGPPKVDGSEQEVSQYIGIQVQLLADAVNEEDAEGVRMLASRLVLYARRCQADQVAQSAGKIHLQSIDEEIQWQTLLGATNELSELCRDFTFEPLSSAEVREFAGSDESSSIGDLSSEAKASTDPDHTATVEFEGQCSLMQGIPVPTERDHPSYFNGAQ
ncbi:MAG: diguanylate cyclase [Planctomycetota bacterium]